ncbi:MAG: transposase [Bacteroidales bacterium]|nr:transposase [Bacteroidales bacterium]
MYLSKTGGSNTIIIAQKTLIFRLPSRLTFFKLSDFESKNVQVRFDLEETSSDGGLLLLKEVDNQAGLIDSLSGCLQDNRHQGYVKHSFDSMLRQRIMQMGLRESLWHI